VPYGTRNNDKKYVKVYNPSGELVEEGSNARINIPFVRREDQGNWTCHVQLPDRTQQMTVTVFLKGIATTNIMSAYEYHSGSSNY